MTTTTTNKHYPDYFYSESVFEDEIDEFDDEELDRELAAMDLRQEQEEEEFQTFVEHTRSHPTERPQHYTDPRSVKIISEAEKVTATASGRFNEYQKIWQSLFELTNLVDDQTKRIIKTQRKCNQLFNF